MNGRMLITDEDYRICIESSLKSCNFIICPWSIAMGLNSAWGAVTLEMVELETFDLISAKLFGSLYFAFATITSLIGSEKRLIDSVSSKCSLKSSSEISLKSAKV